MKTFNQFITERVSDEELRDVEKLADRLFAKLDIDVEFTKHFIDRVNDARNRPMITADELSNMFKKAFYGAGKKISAMNKGSEAVLNDVQKDLNLPFVLKWNDRDKEIELVSKTIMRKKDFKTPDKKIRF